MMKCRLEKGRTKVWQKKTNRRKWGWRRPKEGINNYWWFLINVF